MTQDRKLICLRLVEHTNGLKIRQPERCPNEQLPGSGLCSKHLAEAVGEFRVITTGAGDVAD